ncbi:MAG TPA: ABC transporter ATP-binding protein [Polyangiaceae bacterium LLY-WYZ-14_1]|nr:ABC transporter ATP-binding protein [Polyangiaceae bacterium LLY-WYZ-14_1]
MRGDALTVTDLRKVYRTGFFRRRVPAVQGVSFSVRRGEVFGLLGPNGAGKTTSLKMVLGLVHPDGGEVRFFGEPTGPDAYRRVGYLPENPYVYQYLTPVELLDLCGRLMGMDGAARRARIRPLLERVGLAHARDRRIGKFSKGMMQRVGIAQALLHDPDLLILDEPMSGLDPVGRKEVRDLVQEEKRRGKTVLFTSHILSDVETLCDRVTILRRGRVTAEGSLSTLLRSEVLRTQVELRGVPESLRGELARRVLGHDARPGGIDVFDVEGEAATTRLVADALAAGATLVGVVPLRETLEDLFVRNAVQGDDGPPEARAGAAEGSHRDAGGAAP